MATKRARKVRIGIMSQEKIRERTLAIARGELKPGPRDPKIWFNSMASMAQVLSEDNQALLRIIRSDNPSSVSELARIVERKTPNVSRTLHTLARYGFVELKPENNRVRPVALATKFEIELSA